MKRIIFTLRPCGALREAQAATRLAHFNVSRRWFFFDAFPLIPSGKIAKVAVEKLFCGMPGVAEKVEA